MHLFHIQKTDFGQTEDLLLLKNDFGRTETEK